jgi:hypothetical protein
MDTRSKIEAIGSSIQEGIDILSELSPANEHKSSFTNSLKMNVKVVFAQLIYTKESMAAITMSNKKEMDALRAENAQLRYELNAAREMNPGITLAPVKFGNDESLNEKESLVQHFALEMGRMRSEMQKMANSVYMQDGSKWVDFYKKKYYDQLVIDHCTQEPYICPETGEPLTKSMIYQKERDEALTEFETFRNLVDSMNFTERLEQANNKAAVFERKYRFLKTHVLENFYNSSDLSSDCDETIIVGS